MTSEQKEREALKPCPMCGGKADYNWDEVGPEATRHWYIHCAPDDSFKGCIAHDGRFATLREATKHWNTRTHQAQSEGEMVERMRILANEARGHLLERPCNKIQCNIKLLKLIQMGSTDETAKAALSVLQPQPDAQPSERSGVSERVETYCGNCGVLVAEEYALTCSCKFCGSTVWQTRTNAAIQSTDKTLLPLLREAREAMQTLVSIAPFKENAHLHPAYRAALDKNESCIAKLDAAIGGE